MAASAVWSRSTKPSWSTKRDPPGPRSNPATYVGAFGAIRDLYSELPLSRQRGYGPGRFSFNVSGGRCEACKGDGLIRIDMHFLTDVYVTCETCRGRRYNEETLQVTFRGKSVADVLEMGIDEGRLFFQKIPAIYAKLKALCDVGLGYLKLGQPANTLSGGEAQRVKLAAELAKRRPAKPSTSSTSRPPVCTSRISAPCSKYSFSCATRATR